ncbi:NmrA family transcriptional regulator [Nonomuraea sp. NPDC050404]|uniref:NmrA family NAD(P)-binding protein n=1 Tax=Nonomuraea sp. NPDC050404 TaxID=3155783 RepID=UPI0033C7DF75
MTSLNIPAVLIIGGRGTTGSRVADRLTALGGEPRIGSRTGTPPFMWEDPSTWPAALEDVSAVYIVYPDLLAPEAEERVAALARAAVERGARRLVLLSGRSDSNELGLEGLEDSIKDLGAEWTVLRPGWFCQNLETMHLQDILNGEFLMPEGTFTEAFIDAEDIADVAVAALTEDGHHGRTYELTGPRLLTFTDVAKELSQATGRTIIHTRVPLEQYLQTLVDAGMPAEQAQEMAGLSGGNHGTLADGVQQALGRPPREFADYVRATAATGVWNA